MDTLIMADNFLTQLLTNMQSQLERLEEKVDTSNRLANQAKDRAEDIDKRVANLESQVSGSIEKKDMPASPFNNPKVVNIGFFLALAILLIVGAVVGVDIRSIL